jgi:hypothetical protein
LTARRTTQQPGRRPQVDAPEAPDDLGELSFEDWYSHPIFETDIDPDERLEHLAMSRRRPARLLGGARVRMAARHGTDRNGPPSDAANNEQVSNGPVRNGPVRNEPVRNEPVRNEPVRNEPVRNGPVRNGPVRNGPVRNEQASNEPADDRPESAGWRDRAGRMLDRWAEREAAGQQRLEQALLPRRWRG